MLVIPNTAVFVLNSAEKMLEENKEALKKPTLLMAVALFGALFQPAAVSK